MFKYAILMIQIGLSRCIPPSGATSGKWVRKRVRKTQTFLVPVSNMAELPRTRRFQPRTLAEICQIMPLCLYSTVHTLPSCNSVQI